VGSPTPPVTFPTVNVGVLPEMVAPIAGFWIIGAVSDDEVGESLPQASPPRVAKRAAAHFRSARLIW
jgi:hypothetical protein